MINMMNYEEFKEKVARDFLKYMPEAYKTCEVKITPVKMVNYTLDGMMLFKPASENKTGNNARIFPTIYLNNMYLAYMDTNDIEEVIVAYADEMTKVFKDADSMLAQIDYATVSEKVIYQLVNTEKNKEFLSDKPHREFFDLSVVYRWVLDENDPASASALITNAIAEKVNLSEEDLYELAAKNTPRLLKPVITTFDDVIKGLMNDTEYQHFLEKEGLKDEKFKNNPLTAFIITNKTSFWGATTIFDKDILAEVSRKLDSDLYLLPSSIHDMIAVPASTMLLKDCYAMVFMANAICLSPDESLSNQIYFYDKETGKISLATTVSEIVDEN